VITGPARNHDACERLRGVRAAQEAAGRAWDDAWVVEGDFLEESGYRGATSLLQLGPTALIAGNDSMAIGALAALTHAGVRVPEDVAVVGFDDIPIARYVSPPLTTVRVSIAALGSRAAARVLEALEQGPGRERKQQLLPTELIIRRSCGARTGV
jgi:LacI family transcriptional regulator